MTSTLTLTNVSYDVTCVPLCAICHCRSIRYDMYLSVHLCINARLTNTISYKNASEGRNPPHIYRIADAAYTALRSTWSDQSIIVSGESGAGKTESTKLVLEFLMVMSERSGHSGGLNRSRSSSRAGSAATSPAGGKLSSPPPASMLGSEPCMQTLEDQCLYAQTLLEAFGNAKTLRNDNSSRFGKWFEVYFSRSGAIVGANIVTYLLEKSRVVMVDDGERNYHVFYRLLAACKQREHLRKAIFGATATLEDDGGAACCDDRRYRYLNQSATNTATGEMPVEDFDKLTEAMQVFEIDEERREGIFRTVAGVLLLGNVDFRAKSVVSAGAGSTADGCEVVDANALHSAAMALRIESEKLESALTTRRLSVGGASSSDFVSIPYTPAEACGARDALAKAVYAGLFRWICNAMNAVLVGVGNVAGDTGASHDARRTIGILDIFGFEDLHVNSFEQLCINYCNERLHGHYNEECFRVEQAVYAEEGVNIDAIPFVDNADAIALFEDKRTGLMAMMDTEIYTPGGSNQGFLDKCCTQHGSHSSFSRPSVKEDANSFKVHHYAGSVSYSTADLLEKCRDFLHADLERCATESGDDFTATIVRERHGANQQQQGKAGGGGGSAVSSRRGSTGRQATLGVQFMNSLGRLMRRLMSTQPHFVKCIKPNGTRSPSTFVETDVLAQLRYSGLLSLCKLRQIGFPARMTQLEFVRRFGVVAGKDASFASGDVHVLINILTAQGVLKEGGWLVGHTRVLMKQVQNDAIEDALRRTQEASVVVIQAAARRWSARRRYLDLLRGLSELKRALRDLTSCGGSEPHENVLRKMESVERAVDCVGSSELVLGRSVRVPSLEEAERVLARAREEQAAVEMLMSAINARDATGLTHAVAYASRIGLDGHQQLTAAQALLTRLAEEEEVVIMVREAMLNRDDVKLAKALAMPAAAELLKDRNGAIYEEVNEGRQMLQRLQAERQLTADYEAAARSGDTKRLEVICGEMKAFGMSQPVTTVIPEGASITVNDEEVQRAADERLQEAIFTGDARQVHDCMNAAIHAGLQDSEGVAIAREMLSASQEHVRLMTQMGSVANVIQVKLRSVLGVEAQELHDLEVILDSLEGIEAELSREETEAVERGVKALNDGKKASRTMAEMRACLEREAVRKAESKRESIDGEKSTSESSGESAHAAIAKDFKSLGHAVATARELGMKCLLLADAEILLSRLQQRNEHIAALESGGSSMSQIVRIAIAPRWRIDRFKQLRSPGSFARPVLFNKKRVMDSMLTFSREALPNSLTQLPSAKVKSAIACHKGLLGFSGTKKTTFPASFGHHILSRALNDVDLRNEVFLQIVKQMKGNPDPRSIQRCWILMALCVDAFGPTAEFELYLINFLISSQRDERFGRYCTYCLEKLESELDVDEDHLNDMIYRRRLPRIEDIDDILHGRRKTTDASDASALTMTPMKSPPPPPTPSASQSNAM